MNHSATLNVSDAYKNHWNASIIVVPIPINPERMTRDGEGKRKKRKKRKQKTVEQTLPHHTVLTNEHIYDFC